jgi:hypothetical protein
MRLHSKPDIKTTANFLFWYIWHGWNVMSSEEDTGSTLRVWEEEKQFPDPDTHGKYH